MPPDEPFIEKHTDGQRDRGKEKQGEMEREEAERWRSFGVVGRDLKKKKMPVHSHLIHTSSLLARQI